MVKKNTTLILVLFTIVFAAILVWADAKPTVTLNMPANAMTNATVNQTFNCTAIDDYNVTNITLYIYNLTTLWNTTYRVATAPTNSTYIQIFNLPESNYTWNCLAYDNNTNLSWASVNFTFIIDTTKPYFTAVPATVALTYGQTLGVDFNATDTNLFDSYVVNGTLLFSINSSGWLKNITTLIPGTWNVNITINDSANNLNSTVYTFTVSKATSNITLRINNTEGNLTINAIYPIEGNNTNISVYIYNPAALVGGNLSIYINGTLRFQNTTATAVYVANLTNFTTTTFSLSTGLYNITAVYNESQNYTGKEVVWWILKDLDYPTVTAITAVSTNTSANTAYNFTYNVSDVTSGITNCTLIINSMTGQSNVSTTQNNTREFIETGTLGAGTYSWLVSCTDQAANVANSSLKSLTVTDVVAAGSTANAPGGGNTVIVWTNTYIPTDSQLILGYNQNLKVKEKIKIIIDTKDHYVGVKSLTSTTAALEIASVSINATMSVGETKKFDVTDDGYYDISVILNSIANNKADITIQRINELIPVVVEEETPIEEVVGNITDTVNKVSAKGWIIIGAVVIVLIIIISYKASRKKRYHKKGY